MKFDDQLAAYLYEYKTLRLEGIGTFTLDSKVSVPGDQEKEIFYPIEGLSFDFNPKSFTDENIITFLVKKLHKIEPLIRSDLESYLANIKQFLNLGKPYTIQGVGTLTKNNHGVYEFTPGNFLPVKEELNPRRENAEHNYPVRSSSSAARVFVIILIVIAALAALGGIGWGISNLIVKQQTEGEDVSQQGMIDTIPQQQDTAPLTRTAPPVSTPAPVTERPLQPGDSVSYKMVFETTRFRQRATSRTAQLNTYGTRSRYDTIKFGDSLRYRLFVPVRIRPADTIRVRDSLSKFLGRRVRVVRQ